VSPPLKSVPTPLKPPLVLEADDDRDNADCACPCSCDAFEVSESMDTDRLKVRNKPLF
jgi:hypothetical protein